MPRLFFKPASSFFRKITLGAVGAAAVASDLSCRGHEVTELERGSTDTKIWKDVKRKRVRIPDLVCTKCGLRVESRAKSKPDFSMSHSPSEEARAWDFGMVNSDIVAFPVCKSVSEQNWTMGRLKNLRSHWTEQNWIDWKQFGAINYLRVENLRSVAASRSSTKGFTEGSETSISWDSTFSTRSGQVKAVIPNRVTVSRKSDGHSYTWKIKENQSIRVVAGQVIDLNEVLASSVELMSPRDLQCPLERSPKFIPDLLKSREKTQRFTGVKIARIRQYEQYCDGISELVLDEVEDVYVRLEGAAYLVSVCSRSAETLFRPFLSTSDQQNQLEAVIVLGETATSETIAMLGRILNDETSPSHLRSAAAWSLATTRTLEATSLLIKAFSDIDLRIREEALEGIVSMGHVAVPSLLKGLESSNDDLGSGCAEALRQIQSLLQSSFSMIAKSLESRPPIWLVWLVGNLSKSDGQAVISETRTLDDRVRYAITVLLAFSESWVANHWISSLASWSQSRLE